MGEDGRKWTQTLSAVPGTRSPDSRFVGESAATEPALPLRDIYSIFEYLEFILHITINLSIALKHNQNLLGLCFNEFLEIQ